jgi:hypothetical protein
MMVIIDKHPERTGDDAEDATKDKNHPEDPPSKILVVFGRYRVLKFFI